MKKFFLIFALLSLVGNIFPGGASAKIIPSSLLSQWLETSFFGPKIYENRFKGKPKKNLPSFVLKKNVDQKKKQKVSQNQKKELKPHLAKSTSSVPGLQTSANESVSSTKNSDSLDCGFSDLNKIKEITYEKGKETTTISDFDKDEAFTCMGKALLNNCQKAHVKTQSKNGTIIISEIIEKDGENCILRETYEKVTPLDTELKEYENSYLQCGFSSTELKESACAFLSTEACNFFGIKNSFAHIYMGAVFSIHLTLALSPDEPRCLWKHK